MANNVTLNIPENFQLDAMAEELSERYQSKGFKVNVLKMKKGVKLTFDKNCGGINMLLGLGQGITVTCMVRGKENDMLSINFSNGDWTGKIVGCLVGWFLCFVPIITAIIGIFKQVALPNEITNEIEMLVSEQE
ncbi:MAG: hypothetical protein ACI4U2_01100 [Christensenellaceae bacterium]